MRPEDEPALRRMHERAGIDYRFPDLGSPLFFVRKVIEREDGALDGALVLRLCAETMLLLGEQGPREKYAAMQELQAEAGREAWERGLDEIHAVIPAEIGFERRLRELGWAADRPGWTLWSRSTR